MDSFWSKLLILGIVAAIGLFFIHNVYTPQRSAQEAMAESTQQSVNAVKAGVEETLPIVSASEVEEIARDNFNGSNDRRVVIEKANRDTYYFETGTSLSSATDPTSLGNKSLSAVLSSGSSYRQSNSLESIRFIEMD